MGHITIKIRMFSSKILIYMSCMVPLRVAAWYSFEYYLSNDVNQYSLLRTSLCGDRGESAMLRAT